MPVSCAPCFVLLFAPSAAVLFLILFAKNTDLISDAPILACVWCVPLFHVNRFVQYLLKHTRHGQVKWLVVHAVYSVLL